MSGALQEERRREIVKIVNQNGKASISEICEIFGVSEMTARRDLRDLDRDGMLRRVHGGAINRIGRSYEPAFQLRQADNAEEKIKIGKKAAEFVFDGDSIALDTGTTILELARALAQKRNLTIVTSSVTIANEIIANFSLLEDVRLILTGGIVRGGELSMVGDSAEYTYRNLHVDKAFIGIAGVSLQDGLTEYNLEDALTKQALINSAQQKIVLADSTKFGRTTFASVCSLSQIDRIITDANTSPEIIEALSQIGIDVVIAD